ncbi:putative Y47D3B.4, partial [Operophtera brumata]
RNFSTEVPLFCQTRSINPDDDFIEVVAAKPLEIWWREWDATLTEVDTPLLLSCPLTEPLFSSSVVSIVTQPCDDPINAFSLDPVPQKTPKRKFTICVKDMNFAKIISTNIIEWIEINKILGVDIIDMYIDKISNETEEILQYYRDKGFVRLFSVPIRNKRDRSLWQRRRDHIVTYNDCLYRNIMESEFIIPLDVDEIILPKNAENLLELLQRLSNYGWDLSQHSAIMIRNVFFFDFMQGVENYKKTTHMSKSKIYTKRDDVRIKDSENLDIGDIELVGDVDSISNEVIDTVKLALEKYKMRCGTELPIPKIGKHFMSSAMVSPIGSYTKSIMVTNKVLTAFNHYPLASLGAAGFAGWAAPFSEVQLNHYKESCNSTVVAECARYGRRARVDTSALHLYQRLTSVLANRFCTKINSN